MSDYLGDFSAGAVVRYLFATSAAGMPATLSGSPAVSIYKNALLTEGLLGVTLTVDHDGRTGLNLLEVDTSASPAFYASADFAAVITAGTIGGASAVGRVLCQFSIQNRSLAAAQTAILAKLPAALVGGRIDASVGSYPGNVPQTGDNFARLGAPAGASVSADIAAVKSDTGGTLTAAVATLVAVDTEVAAIKAKTDQLAFTTPNQVDASSTGGPTAAAIADAVYDELLSGHTVSGSGGEALNRLDGIAAKTALISSGTSIVVTTPVTEGGDIDDIVPGDAYDLDHARSIPFTFSGAPNLTASTVTLVIATSGGVMLVSKVATSVVPGAGDQDATFELTAAQTALLTRIGRPAYRHQVQAVWPADSPTQPAVLVEGVVHTRRRFA